MKMESLVKCEVILKSVSRSKRGVILKFELKEEDFTATMAVLPLDEPMTLDLHEFKVGV
jgi:hypothetical protein